jgi:hypothetical protein
MTSVTLKAVAKPVSDRERHFDWLAFRVRIQSPEASTVMSVMPVRTILLALGGAAAVGLASGATAQLLSTETPGEVRVVQGATTAGPSPATSPSPLPTQSSTGVRVTAAADKPSAAPMERIGIAGRVTPATSGLEVRVQRDRDGQWSDFPAESVTGKSGKYSLWVQVGVKGEQSFRIVTKVDGESVASEPLVVRIG